MGSMGSMDGIDSMVAAFAALIFLACIFSPPNLMDDVDAVQPQIARHMLESGDWVTPRLDGVAYLEKPPLKYWMMAVSFLIFGVHDWAARLPVALAAVLLCWVVARFGAWAFGRAAGLYAGLALATCVGLFLFTRVLISDVILTLAITLSLWSLARALDDDEAHPAAWAMLLWAAMGVGLLLKGLIAAVIPVGSGLLYLAASGQWRSREAWGRLRVLPGLLLLLAIAAPWHVLAILRNPPYLDFTLHAEPGSYRGFFWFYFINEHMLRYLNLRYPRDYNTVPRLDFWLFHLLWLFPWSVYLPALFRMDYGAPGRASRVRLMALCWTACVLGFFTFSTTQEYYSMPCYPALALLIGAALERGGQTVRIATRVAAAVASMALTAVAVILWLVRGLPASGDIASALSRHPKAYTLSLGHMTDLTLAAFAYLRLPLALAGVAFVIGAAGAWRFRDWRATLSLAVMMTVLFHAARLAMVVFDPYLSSRALADGLLRSPAGQLIVDDPYYEFSSVFFYSNRTALLLNGRVNNLEYGSYAPGAPQVFIDDAAFARLWLSPQRYYTVTEGPKAARLERLVGKPELHLVVASGGKLLFSNH
jgi:4-amino-4-deoxy-L-arabinose transferase-like glycosyltransferase